MEKLILGALGGGLLILILGALGGGLLILGVMVRLWFKAWRASKIPKHELERVHEYKKWLELDVIEREERMASMTAEQRKAIRAAEVAYHEYGKWIESWP